MPYALREGSSGLLLACMQINGYQLPYYGVVLWETQPEEEAITAALLKADQRDPSLVWQPVELTEHQAKMANVKLRNDPRRQVFLVDQTISVTQIQPM